MKLKTSFFKPVTLKKDILRFAPIWVLYSVGMLLIFMGAGDYSDYDRFARNNLQEMVSFFGVANLVYAAIVANLLFGDLYNTKLCYSLHAMPYRRESWMATHLVSGLLFSLVPNLLTAVYLCVQLEGYWFLGLCWLLAVMLQFIFFFGIATVSALLTGNRFAMLVVYAGFHFIAMLLYAAVELIYVPMLNGVVANQEAFTRFSPVVELFTFNFFQFTRTVLSGNDIYGNVQSFYCFDGLADGWGYLAILGCVGVAAMAFGFWLYRKRHLESAGDFVAFPKLKGLACVIMTLCVTLCFAVVGELFGNTLTWLCIGLVIGFFGSLMLLERRLKVFRKKTFLGFGVMAVTVTLSVLAIYFDWFGIESWTPKADRVASVTVSDSRYNNRYSNSLTVTLEDEYDISQIIVAHEDILTRLDDKHSSSYYQVYLTYKMKSGRTVSRYYYVPTTGDGYQIVRRYLYQTNAVLGFADATTAAANITYMYSSVGEVPSELYEKVLCALQIDCTNGHVLPDVRNTKYYLEYGFINSEGETVYRSLEIGPGAENVIALLNGPEIAMGYSDWAEFVKTVQKFTLSDKELSHKLSQDLKEDLLMAIRKDIEAGCDFGGRGVGSYDYVVSYYVPYPSGRTDYRELYITAKAQYTMAWLAANGYIPSETPHT